MILSIGEIKIEVNLERWVWSTPFLLLPFKSVSSLYVFDGQKSECKPGGKSIFITNINTWYKNLTPQG